MARPNEKGVVEGTVKYTRLNFFVPVTQVRNLEELNAILVEQCRDDMKRRLRGGTGTKAELLIEDQAAFIPLPPSSFDACRKRSTRASSLSLIRFDDNDYSVPVAYAHHEILTKGYIDCVVLCQRSLLQARNLMELMESIAKNNPDDEEVEVQLITSEDEYNVQQQTEYLVQIKDSCITIGISLTWEFDQANSIHARHITTDQGWKILLDRGLDIFHHYEMKDAFAINNRLQQYRSVKAFEVTYIKLIAIKRSGVKFFA